MISHITSDASLVTSLTYHASVLNRRHLAAQGLHLERGLRRAEEKDDSSRHEKGSGKGGKKGRLCSSGRREQEAAPNEAGNGAVEGPSHCEVGAEESPEDRHQSCSAYEVGHQKQVEDADPLSSDDKDGYGQQGGRPTSYLQ